MVELEWQECICNFLHTYRKEKARCKSVFTYNYHMDREYHMDSDYHMDREYHKDRDYHMGRDYHVDRD